VVGTRLTGAPVGDGAVPDADATDTDTDTDTTIAAAG
jgi:hypothetical protein